MEQKWYDILAKAGRLYLPSASVLIGTLGKIWGLPYAEQLSLTITAVAGFINAWLGINLKSYWEKHEIVEKEA